MGQPLLQLPLLVGGEREAMVMAPAPMCGSVVSPCFHGWLTFLHQHFPPQSPPSPPLNPSLQSAAAFALGSHHTPQALAPSCCTFQGTCIPVRGMYGYGKDCLILIPFRLPQISCFTLSLKCFCSDSDNCPDMEIGRLASVPPPAKGRSSPTNTPVSLPSSCVLLSFVWFYTFFSSGQVLRPALSWCPACASVSEGVFLMYL